MNDLANPYVGPVPFETGQKLYGRDREARQLREVLIAERIVLFHSPSGAGKTSLVQASLIPDLKGKNFEVLPLIRMNKELDNKEPPSSGKPNRYKLSTLICLETNEAESKPRREAVLSWVGKPLTDYFGERGLLVKPRDESSADVPRQSPPPRARKVALIFDQFEEILTLDEDDIEEKKAFFNEVADVMRHRNFWAIFVVREEYIGALGQYVGNIPTQLNMTYHMGLLEPAGAKQAIEEPPRAQPTPVTFVDDSAKMLVDELLTSKDELGEPRLARFVEPVVLQVTCQQLWEQWKESSPQKFEINEDHIKDIKVNEVLSKLYEESVQAAAQAAGIDEDTVRKWCEDSLITKRKTRASTFEGAPGDIAVKARKELVARYLVREEQRDGVWWYELAHDRLIEPILKSKEYREKDRQIADARRKAIRRAAWLGLAGLVIALLVAVMLAVFAERNAEEAKQSAEAAGNFVALVQTLLRGENLAAARAVALAAIDKGQSYERAHLAFTEVVYAPGTRRVFPISRAQTQVLAAVSDGRVALASYWDGALILWNLEQKPVTPTVLREAKTPPDRALSLALNRNNTSALVGGANGVLSLWDLGTPPNLRKAFKRQDSGKFTVLSIAFSPDEKTALAGYSDGKLLLWDLAKENGPIHVFENSDMPVESIAISPDGHKALTGYFDGKLLLWDLSGEYTNKPIETGLDAPITSVAFSADGSTALTGAGYPVSDSNGTDISLDPNNTDVSLWKIASGQRLRRFTGQHSGVSYVAYGPDGQTIVAGMFRGDLMVWNPQTGQQLLRLTDHTGQILNLVFGPNWRTIITVSTDDTVREWDIASGAELRRDTATAAVTAVAFSSDGQTVLYGDMDGNLSRSDAETGKLLKSFEKGRNKPVSRAMFSKDGQYILSESDFDSLTLWNADGKLLKTIDNPNVTSAALSPDNEYLLAGLDLPVSLGMDPILLLNATTGKQIRSFPSSGTQGHSEGVLSVAFSPDGKTFVSGSGDTTLILWDINGDLLRKFELHTGKVFCVVFSPDGRTILSGSDDHSLILWDVATGKPLRRFYGHQDAVLSVAYSADGNLAVSGSRDGSLRIWDLQSGLQIRQYEGHEADVTDVAIDKTGNRIISSSSDKTVRVWQFQTIPGIIAWLPKNRYVPPLTCADRQLYGIAPLCSEQQALTTPTAP